MQLKCKRKICVMYGEGVVTDWICQKWLAKFLAGGFSSHDAPQSGRPVEVDSNQIETLRTVVIPCERLATYPKYPGQGLKIICTSLVISITEYLGSTFKLKKKILLNYLHMWFST